jgi:hypothetical protein
MVKNIKFHKSREFLGKLSNLQIFNNTDAAQYSCGVVTVMQVTLNSMTLSLSVYAELCRIQKEAMLP